MFKMHRYNSDFKSMQTYCNRVVLLLSTDFFFKNMLGNLLRQANVLFVFFRWLEKVLTPISLDNVIFFLKTVKSKTPPSFKWSICIHNVASLYNINWNQYFQLPICWKITTLTTSNLKLLIYLMQVLQLLYYTADHAITGDFNSINNTLSSYNSQRTEIS